MIRLSLDSSIPDFITTVWLPNCVNTKYSIIESNLRNLTKALDVTKRDKSSKCEFQNSEIFEKKIKNRQKL